MTLSAFAWNIVRTYALTPGRRYSFGCRYRLGTASNLVMYVSAADNDYVGVTGTFLGTASQGVWSTARLDFSAPPGGGSGCSHPRSLRPRCAWPGPRCSRCWGEPSSLTARRPWGPGSALLWRPPPRRPLRRPKSAAICRCDGVVAEQRGCDARGRCRVLVCG